MVIGDVSAWQLRQTRHLPAEEARRHGYLGDDVMGDIWDAFEANGDKRGKYQDQPGLTLPFVPGDRKS